MTVSYHTSLEFIKIWLSADGSLPPWKSRWLRGANGGMGKGGVAEGRSVGGHHQTAIRTTILEQEINDILVSCTSGIEEA